MPTVHEERAPTWSSVHLDAVRGLAALAVMGFHDKSFFFNSLTTGEDVNATANAVAQPTVQATTGPVAPAHRRADMGNTPVMIFFVLSGYLVGGSVLNALRKQRWSSKTYLIKRLTRLWVVLIPALLLGVLLDNMGYRLFGAPGQIYVAHIGFVYPHIQEDFTLKTIFGNIAFLQGIFVSTPGTNGALWSLGNEFWYYILFPLLVVPFALRSSTAVKAACVAFVIAFLAYVSYRSDPESLKHIPILFPIWIFGALLSLAPLRLADRWLKPMTAVTLLVVVGVTAALRKFDVGIHASQYIIGILFTGLLYVLLHYRGASRAGLYRSIANFFSKISYSLYALHMPVGAFLAAWLLRPWHLRAKSPTNLLVFLGFCALITAVASVFWYLFERNTDAVREWVFGRKDRELERISPNVPVIQR